MCLAKEKEKLIKDLNLVFKLALEEKDFNAAIQAKKTIATIINELNTKKLNLQELSPEELDLLVNSLEDNYA